MKTPKKTEPGRRKGAHEHMGVVFRHMGVQ